MLTAQVGVFFLVLRLEVKVLRSRLSPIPGHFEFYSHLTKNGEPGAEEMSWCVKVLPMQVRKPAFESPESTRKADVQWDCL